MATKKKTITKASKATNVTKPGIPQADPTSVTLKPGELILIHSKSKDRKVVDIYSFYSDKCIRLLEPLAEMVQDEEVSCSPYSTLKLQDAFEAMSTVKEFRNMGRTQMAEIYEAFGSDLRNIISICNADKRYENTWKTLTLNFDVSTLDLKHQLGREIRMERDYGWVMEIAPEVLFAPALVTDAMESYNSARHYYEITGRLSLRGSDRRVLADHFFGKDYAEEHLTATLPENANLTIDNFEQATVSDLMTLEGVALNGSMLSANGSITAAAVKKIKTQTQIPDFAHVEGKWPLDRVELLALTYFTMDEVRGKNENIDIKTISRFAADKMARYISGPVFNSFMPAWQSFTKSWTSETYTMEITSSVRAILMGATEEWMNLDNFKIMLLCEEPGEMKDNRYLRLFPYKGRSKSTATRKIDKEHEGDRKWKIDRIDWFEEMGLKFAIHWIKYLCAMGIVELAMDTGVKDIADDPMEGMRYVRITPLGRYAFGIDKNYSPKAAAADTGVEFDPRNGIITIDAKSPYQMFLGNIAKRISPTRFSISTETLLKGCKTKADLEQRVNNLRIILDPEKETGIRKIIDDAILHTDCAEREGGYSLLKLRGDLPGLRQAILSNYELREMTILAGPTLALVKTHKMERFNAICAAYGYLME